MMLNCEQSDPIFEKHLSDVLIRKRCVNIDRPIYWSTLYQQNKYDGTPLFLNFVSVLYQR